MSETRPERRSSDVPIRTIAATILLFLATYLTWLFIKATWDILELILVAVFFALTMNPAVDFVQRRAGLGRGLATTIVFLTALAGLFGLLYLFIQPVVQQTQLLIERLPQMIDDAQRGRGTVGELIQRYDLNQWVRENQARLSDALTNSTGVITAIFGRVASTIVSLLTVLVLSFLMLLEGPRLLRAPLIFFEPEKQNRIRGVAADASRAVTGYMAGNVVISVIAGTVTYVTLRILGIPFAAVLAVWVAVVDLIPLVGATLGAIVTVSVALINDPWDGLIAFIVYVVYQQIENHLLQPTIMAKTVRLNPLAVIVSVLIGVELAGLLGALFAIPIAGIIQVIGRDIFDHRNVRLKGEPTVGTAQVPLGDVPETEPRADREETR